MEMKSGLRSNNQHKSVQVYAKASKLLHWIIAFIVILMLSLSFFMDDVSDLNKPSVYMVHKSFGLTVLVLMILRIVWMIHRGRPDLPKTVPHWEKVFSRTVQYGFYVFLLIMPLSGWILSCAADHIPQFFGFISVPFPGISPNKSLADFMDNVHKIVAWILIGLLFLHVSGALKHHFWDRDSVLKRMWF